MDLGPEIGGLTCDTRCVKVKKQVHVWYRRFLNKMTSGTVQGFTVFACIRYSG